MLCFGKFFFINDEKNVSINLTSASNILVCMVICIIEIRQEEKIEQFFKLGSF